MIIESPMDKILNLKAYQYNFNQKIIEGEDTIITKIPEYGFVSQEVKETLKDVAITEEGKEGIILMDYDQIIPLLVAGVQEQQRQISSLEATIAILMSRTPESGNTIDSTEVNSNSDVSRLDNATPNPFSESTSITYRLASNVTTASIKVWDMQGIEKKAFNLNTQIADGKVEIQSSDLNVGSSYIYALIINGAIVSSKTLIFVQ